MTTVYRRTSDTEIRCQKNIGNDTAEITTLTLVDGEWQKLNGEVVDLSGVEIEPRTQSEIDAEVVNNFKSERQRQLDEAVVETSAGYKFDADEQSIGRMANAILAAREDGGDNGYAMQWSLADDGTGVMTDLTLGDICEAHKLAVKNMAAIWSI